MSDRLPVQKTLKLFIGGSFPRSESGRSTALVGASGQTIAHASRASRKDLRSAVEAAQGARGKWAGMSALLRGQILYRVAEMLEGKREELAASLRAIPDGVMSPEAEVAASIDRLVCFAGWADKYAQVLGCNNPVAGPYYTFTIPEPVGCVGIVSPDRLACFGMVALLAPVLCAGNTAVVIASEANPVPGVLLAEACATGDVPPGVVNVLTGPRAELLPWLAGHREVDGVHACPADAKESELLRGGAAENLKRVTLRDEAAMGAETACGPWWIEPFVDMKTIWHPSAT